MKRILVAGGAGFIGSGLCERLLTLGNIVYCVDDLSSGLERNVRRLLATDRFEFLKHDIAEPLYIEVDEIYNLACSASPVFYQANAIHTATTCTMGALNTLRLAEATGAKILLASTSEVYGDPLVHPQSEEYWGNVNPIGPRACYNEGKRCAEMLFEEYYRQYGVRTKIARIFNTYGPGMREDDGRVVSNIITRALLSDPIEIHGSGGQTRSFCYVDDMVEGLILLMDAADGVRGPINFGSTEELSIRSLAELVLSLTGSTSRIELLLERPDDPKRRRPDIARALGLGWAPKISLTEGLKLTVKYFEALVAVRNELATRIEPQVLNR